MVGIEPGVKHPTDFDSLVISSHLNSSHPTEIVTCHNQSTQVHLSTTWEPKPLLKKVFLIELID